jgi:uncharacterized membrane protein YoaK (UPF0700 family)
VVIVTRLLDSALLRRKLPALKLLLGLKVALLLAAAVLAVRFGPFADGDSWPAILTGMTLVAAMSIQNAIHRIHLASVPPSTVMTGTTTQIMIGFADLLQGLRPEPSAAPAWRLLSMSFSVVVFGAGCATAAFLYLRLGMWFFWLPPLLGLVILVVRTSGSRDAS